ncbi:MAG: ATP-binding protein [Planctomycetota bacterium]
MLQRAVHDILLARLAESPAVALVGPRQCGKTTLAQSLGGNYFDLEQEPDRLRLDLAWDRLVAADVLTVLDEAQAWPPLFSRLRGAIDARRRKNGRFLLLGSVAPTLMRQVSESLAGRLALLELTPFFHPELPTAAARERLWFNGGYPDGGVLGAGHFPRWQLDYLSLLAARDLPNWGLPAKPQLTDRLLRMLAALHGQNWNASQVGQSLGLSYHTVNEYLDYLEGAFLIRRLPPFQINLAKRLVKRPKIFWRDSGLLHALMNVPDFSHLLNQPWVGASWEGFVIEQAIRQLAAQGRHAEPFFFRTNDGHEIDLVLELAGKRFAIDVKLSSAPGPEDADRLNKAADLIGAQRRILVSRTRHPAENARFVSCDLAGLLERLTAA